MSVAAGMTRRMRLSAFGAVPKLTAGLMRTAARQITQDPPVRRRHAGTELLHVRGAVAADDVRQRAHYRSLMSRPTCWAAADDACSVRWV